MTMRFVKRLWLVAAALVAIMGCMIAEGSPAVQSRDGGQDLMDTGIVITGCQRDTRGILVNFGTFHEPPYLVGIYPSYDYLEYGYIAEVATTNKSVYISGDFTDYPALVKVILPSRIAEVNYGGFDFHRQLTKAEIAEYAAPCRNAPIPDVIRTTHWTSTFGPEGPMLYTGSFVVKRYWSITDDDSGITYTASANTTITFKNKPVRSAVPGEDHIIYWTRSTVNDDPYDPSTRNEWCMWSDTPYPKYVMYNVGPLYALTSPPSTNYTMEALQELAEQNPGGSVEIRYEVPGQNLELVRGTVTSASTVADPTISIFGDPIYGFALVTNEQRFVEYNHGWGLHPMSEPRAGTEMLWMEMSNKTNVSNTVYLPRLLKGIPTDGPLRMTTDWFGQAIMVTNTPNHWATDFGIVDIPPGSNDLYRVSIVPDN